MFSIITNLNNPLGEYYPLGYYITIVLWLIMNLYFIDTFEEKELIRYYRIMIIISYLLLMFKIFSYIRDMYRYALLTWLLFAYMIIDDYESLILSYPFIIFYSDFYEIPIYLRELIIMKDYSQEVLTIGVKISTILIIIFIMKIYDYDIDEFIDNIIKFTLFITVFGLITLPVFAKIKYLSVITLKFICLVNHKYIMSKVRK